MASGQRQDTDRGPEAVWERRALTIKGLHAVKLEEFGIYVVLLSEREIRVNERRVSSSFREGRVDGLSFGVQRTWQRRAIRVTSWQ
jgi:hypothetical protein